MSVYYRVEKRSEDDLGRTYCVVNTQTNGVVRRTFMKELAEDFADRLQLERESELEQQQQDVADLINGYDPLHAAHASTDDEPDDEFEAWVGSDDEDEMNPANRRYSVVVEGGTVKPGERVRYLIHDHQERRAVHSTVVAEHAHKLCEVFEAESRAAFEAAWSTLTEDDDDDTGIPLADRLIAEADRLDAGQSPGLVSFRWMAAMLRDLAIAAKATDAKEIAQAIERREVMG